MSTGISISSINRIKELAEEKKYAEALEILDTQNLDKSINPQFLRISGEIFRENKRYYDSRKILLKAHQMSPQGIRIIYEQIQLYLELGYFTRAKKYYEEYLFYSTSEDTQKDYVEYIMKKASGAEVKELAAILIPILERIPEERWNFEAVLLYDKLGRKDKALEESQYILENFKDSIYVKPVIEYIDDKLDVDQYFNVYPQKEVAEDQELFGDLIAEDDKILEADHLRMYPPEARIMVEAEDKDAIETKPIKEKKSKKKRKKKKSDDVNDEDTEQLKEAEKQEKKSESEESDNLVKEALKISEELGIEGEKASDAESKESGEEQIKQEREAALEKLLSKKIDKDRIKESAKQVAKAMKDIDTTKAKSQVLSVAESVKDNVKKATDVLGEAVGAKVVLEDPPQTVKEDKVIDDQEQIVDGIIESVLEPPKKVVGEVLMNEELDALIPDSLEAMSSEEIADIEAKKKEAERLELEALEAAMKLEEDRKKTKEKKETNEQAEDTEETQESVIDASALQITGKEDSLGSVSYEELKARFLAEMNADEKPLDSLGFISVVQSDVDSKLEEDIPDAAGMLHQMIDNKEFYSGEDSAKFESKESYENHGFEVENYDFESYMEDQTNDSLQDDWSDVEEEATKTVSSVEVIYAEKAIVNFEEMVPEDTSESTEKPTEVLEETIEEEPLLEETLEVPEEKPVAEEESGSLEKEVEAENPIGVLEEDFVTKKTIEVIEEELLLEETLEVPEEKPVVKEEPGSLEEEVEAENPIGVLEEDFVTKKTIEVIEEEPLLEETLEVPEEKPVAEEEPGSLEEEVEAENLVEVLEEVLVAEEIIQVVEELEEHSSILMQESTTGELDLQNDRENLRIRILLSDDMLRKLLDLKESR